MQPETFEERIELLNELSRGFLRKAEQSKDEGERKLCEQVSSAYEAAVAIMTGTFNATAA